MTSILNKPVSIAEQYYPTVINKIELVGMHTVMLHTQVLEVSRTKLRELGSIGAWVRQRLCRTERQRGDDEWRKHLCKHWCRHLQSRRRGKQHQLLYLHQALRTNNLVKVMADPTVFAIDGRPASFNSGGEFPILVPAGWVRSVSNFASLERVWIS